MGKIKKLLESELIGGNQNNEVYPITSTKAVFDSENRSLEDILKDINSRIQLIKEAGYLFAGIASPTTNPGTPNERVFYLANEEGTYTYFNNKTISKGQVGVLKYDQEWTLETIGITSLIGSIFLSEKSNITLPYFINEINVSLAFPTQGIDGTNKYDLQQAINTIFNNTQATLKILSSNGTRCTFINKDGDVETWIYNKSGLAISSNNWERINEENIIPGKLLQFSEQLTGAMALDDSNTLDFFGNPINPDDYTNVSVILYTTVTYQGTNRTKGVFLLKYQKDGSYYYAINWRKSSKYGIMDSRNYNNTSISSDIEKNQNYIRSIDTFSDTTYRGICGGNYFINKNKGIIVMRNTSTTDWFEKVIDIESLKNDFEEYKKHEVFMTEDEYDALEVKDESKLYYLYEE